MTSSLAKDSEEEQGRILGILGDGRFDLTDLRTQLVIDGSVDTQLLGILMGVFRKRGFSLLDVGKKTRDELVISEGLDVLLTRALINLTVHSAQDPAI